MTQTEATLMKPSKGFDKSKPWHYCYTVKDGELMVAPRNDSTIPAPPSWGPRVNEYHVTREYLDILPYPYPPEWEPERDGLFREFWKGGALRLRERDDKKAAKLFYLHELKVLKVREAAFMERYERAKHALAVARAIGADIPKEAEI